MNKDTLLNYLRWVIPVMAFVGVAYALLSPLTHELAQTQNRIARIQELRLQEPVVAQRLDSLRKALDSCQEFLRTEQGRMLRAPLTADSLALSARSVGLEVLDLAVAEPDAATPFRKIRLATRGHRLRQVQWLDSLQRLSGLMVLRRARWENMDADPVRLDAEWEMPTKVNVPRPDSLRLHWLLNMARLQGEGAFATLPAPVLHDRLGAGADLPQSTGAATAKILAPPVPAYVLAGAVEGKVATLAASTGAKFLVRPGDSLAGWMVRRVGTTEVELEYGSQRASLRRRP